MTENDLQRAILDAARILGWRAAHFRPCRTGKGWRTPVEGDNGFPDLVLVRGGHRPRLMLLELKSDTGTLTADQLRWQNDLLEVVDGLEAFAPELAGLVEYHVVRPADLDEVLRWLR